MINQQMNIKTVFKIALSAVLLLWADQGWAQEYTITVSAGAFDRTETVTTFTFPDDVKSGVYRMEDEQGEQVYVQVDENRSGCFILDDLEAGSSQNYTLDAEPLSGNTADEGVTHSIVQNTISIKTGDREIFSYIHGKNDPPDELDERYQRGGYIHPVYSPQGTVLTNHLNPMHPHHSGIWSAWTNTEFQGRTPDFWNVHLNSGRVDNVDSLESAWQGPVHAGFKAKHYFTDLSATVPVVALNEKWKVDAYNTNNSDYFLFDLRVIQTANSSQPLKLPEYRYGGVGFRGHEDWDDPDNVTFLTSEGKGRDGHGTRAKWAHIGGESDGELAGIAILSHPDNYRHPQTMRIHPEEPFFNYAPAQLGDMSIEPGTPYIAKYRYITYDGEPNPDEIDRMWNDYAYPPGVTVTVE